jgi:hypothetical protein
MQLLVFLLLYAAAEKTKPNPPTFRASSSLFFLSPSRQLLIIGGSAGLLSIYSDIWLYSLENSRWTYIEPVSTYNPGARTGICGAYYESINSIFIYGGYNPPHLQNDLWKYNIIINAVRTI